MENSIINGVVSSFDIPEDSLEYLVSQDYPLYIYFCPIAYDIINDDRFTKLEIPESYRIFEYDENCALGMILEILDQLSYERLSRKIYDFNNFRKILEKYVEFLLSIVGDFWKDELQSINHSGMPYYNTFLSVQQIVAKIVNKLNNEYDTIKESTMKLYRTIGLSINKSDVLYKMKYKNHVDFTFYMNKNDKVSSKGFKTPYGFTYLLPEGIKL